MSTENQNSNQETDLNTGAAAGAEGQETDLLLAGSNGAEGGEGGGEAAGGEGGEAGAAGGEASKIVIDGKEYTQEQLAQTIGQAQQIQEQVNKLTGADAAQAREINESLKKLLDNQATAGAKQPAFNPEQLAEFKKEYDELAETDFTQASLEIAGAAARSIVAPLIEEIKNLKAQVSNTLVKSQQSEKATKAQIAAENSIKDAFQAANSQLTKEQAPVTLNKENWAAMVVWANQNFGINLEDLAYTNPEALKTTIGTYVRTAKPAGKKEPAPAGDPIGGGSGDFVGDSPTTKADALATQMSSFGLGQK